MKKLSNFFLFFTTILLAQNDQDKIIFLDSLNKETTIENYSYKRVIKDYYKEKTEYHWLEYYKSGNLKSEKKLSGKDGGYPIGEEVQYYENGNKKSSEYYENKMRSGKKTVWYEKGTLMLEGYFNPEKIRTPEYYILESFWNENETKTIDKGNGHYKTDAEEGEYINGLKHGTWLSGKYDSGFDYYTDEYKLGEFISGYRIDANGIRHNYDFLEKKPQPSNGLQDFYQYISKNFNPTREAIKNKVKGRILLAFVVEKDGSIVDIKIIKGLRYGLDEEAVRVIQNCPSWIPGEQRGIPIRCSYNLPLSIDYSK
ncbi:TonB family protein [Flavobacterium sp.]|uniref:TonB family protein n=1 Tax=Flavobacterium sp. TaxID=239 RepID=UPI00391A05CC